MNTIFVCNGPHIDTEHVRSVVSAIGISPMKMSSESNKRLSEIKKHLGKSGSGNVADLSGADLSDFQQFLAKTVQESGAQGASAWVEDVEYVNLGMLNALDTNANLLLVYSSPEHYLGQLAVKNALSAEDVKVAMQAWLAYYQWVLKFYYRHQARCLLVNQAALYGSPVRLTKAINEALNFKLPEAEIGKVHRTDDLVRIASVLAKVDVDGHGAARKLFAQLESSAHLPYSSATDLQEQNAASWADFRGVIESINKLNNELASVQSVAAKIKENASVELGRAVDVQKGLENKISEQAALLHQSIEASQSLESKVSKQTVALAQAVDSRKLLESKVSEHEITIRNHMQIQDELKAENELLLLQLHQLQEEFELHFIECEKHLNGKAEPATGFHNERREANDSVFLDMRDDVIGDNWYYPEADGRWAGPELISTVGLPVLQAGNYKLTLEVVDAMGLEIVQGMSVKLNGENIDMDGSREQVTTSLFAYFTVVDQPVEKLSELELHFPAVISPSEHGSDDYRNLAIRLQHISIEKISN